MDVGSTAPQHVPERRRADGYDAIGRPRLDSSQCANEVLAIVAYITAADGPLQASPRPGEDVSPWHRRLLVKAAERVDIIDAYMRGRVAFLVAGRDQGYHSPEKELELAGTTLDACRATASVIDALLVGRLPTRPEFEAMSEKALGINPALDAVREFEAPSDDR